MESPKVGLEKQQSRIEHEPNRDRGYASLGCGSPPEKSQD